MSSRVDDGHVRERLREGITMALYIALSLLAVMVALPSEVAESISVPALAIVLTALGLLVAHWLAFRISARLAHRGELSSTHLDLLGAQLVGGLTVTVIAALPVFLFGTNPGILVAELLLIAFVAAVSYAAARAGPMNQARALLYVGEVLVITLVVLGIKNLVHY